MDRFTNSPAHRLRSAYLRMHRVTNRAFREFGVTADQYVLLRLLCEEDGLSQQDLGSRSASDATTIGRMLNLLERKQLIQRKQSQDDGRARLVYVTASGRRMTRKLYRAAESIREHLAGVMPDTELKRVLSGLACLNKSMKGLETDGS